MITCNSVIVIPALNPGKELKDYVAELIRQGVTRILVVDDGSDPAHKPLFQELTQFEECTLYTHPQNLGKGRALKNAMILYQEMNLAQSYQGIITVDADGQHAVPDVLRISERMNQVTDQLVLGERAFDKETPLRSRFGNSCTRTLFRLLYGRKIHDTQTGLRGIPNALLPVFAQLEGDRYEYEMQMLITCSLKRIGITSVSIETIYMDNNASSHFHPIKDSFRIYRLLFGSFFRFIFSSLSSFLIDISLFQILVLLTHSLWKDYILISTAGARICSSLYNFLVNKKLVFHSQGGLASTLVKYYLLCLIQLLLSAWGVTWIHSILPINEALIKVVVDTILFLFSYRIQRNHIFRS